MRAPAALTDLAHDAAGDVVAGEELGRAARGLVALRVPPAFLFVVGGLALVEIGDVVEHEPPALVVAQDPALASNPLGHQDSAHARRPDHARRMELEVLHVDEVGARVVREGLSVPGVLPAVAGDLVGAADPSGREHDGLRLEDAEVPPLAVVAEGADDPLAALEEPHHRALHVHVDSEVDSVILERADHLEPGAIAHVGEPRVLVPSEVPLEDFLIRSTVEDRAPGLELPHPIRRLPGVELRHPPVVDVLATAHGVGEMGLPVVPLVHVRERGGDAALGHHRMGFAQKRLADEPYRRSLGGGLDRRPEPRSSGADDEHVVLVGLRWARHQKILQSEITPIEQRRT